MIRIRLALPLALTFASPAIAAPQVWGLQPGSSFNDEIAGLVPNGSGGTIEVGMTQGPLAGTHAGLSDAFAISRDATGAVLWSKQFGTQHQDEFFDADSDGASGFFVAGGSEGGLFGASTLGWDAVVARIGSNGFTAWAVQFGAPWDHDAAYAVARDGSGGCFVGGTTEGDLAASNKGSGDAWVAHYGPTGVQLWAVQFGSSKNDSVTACVSDGAGGVFVAGNTDGNLAGAIGGQDVFYANIDGAGNLQWLRQIGTPVTDYLGDLLLDGAGGLYLGGSAFAFGSTAFATGAVLWRLDAAGNTVWLKTFGAAGDQIERLEPDGSGGLFAAGELLLDGPYPSSASNRQVFLTRFASDGSQGPMTVVGSPQRDDLGGLVWDGASGWVAAGYTFGSFFGTLSGSRDAWIARFETCDMEAFTTYCTGVVNSTGEGARIGPWGSPYLSSNDFALTFEGCPVNQLGIFVMGDAQNSTPFGNGLLCVGGAVSRLLPAQPTGNFGGGWLTLDVTDAGSPASQITPGSTWNFQFWYRDPAAGGAMFNLSNGLSATFCP